MSLKIRKKKGLPPPPPPPDLCSSSEDEVEGYDEADSDSASDSESHDQDPCPSSYANTKQSRDKDMDMESDPSDKNESGPSEGEGDPESDSDPAEDPTNNSSLLDAEEEEQRTSIRRELSSYTFEELEKLKSKLGTKVYNEAMFGKQAKTISRITKKKPVFKRENKNRPRELSSKIRVPRVREVVHVTRKKRRDPRFEDLCGELDEKLWNKDYEFLRDIAKNENETLREKLKTTEMDEEEKERIRLYLQRMKNKERSTAEKEKVEAKQKLAKAENIKRMKEGKRPYFMKKSTQKFVDLAEKYDQLKASGKLESYLKKKRQKNAFRDKKSVKLQRN